MAGHLTNDREIRIRLVPQLEDRASREAGIVVEELGLCQGEARVDVALINGAIHGYEIKSDRDDLTRLEHQLSIYNRSLELATLVVGQAHLDSATRAIPGWWGIVVARVVHGRVKLHKVRHENRNPDIDPLAVAELLWRDEAMLELDARGATRGVRSKPRRFVWARLAEVLTVGELCELVRDSLKSRSSWRSERPPA